MDSQAIVNTMEVLETKPLSELVTEAVIKVCYVSDKPNPNLTVINREVGKEIAASLPGAPVAGFFDRETNDFEQHSRRLTIEGGELIVEDITKAYGFVSPTDDPWYQDFKEDGEVRTYLMCKAYLWTRQYEEASLIANKGQSMELDEKNMSGYYEGNVFVFTSATLDKLCILGDAYAPCFAGAKIMTTYAKQFESLAEQLENTIGRRYYVMDEKLATKPITLEYALELGWNLESAIYNQLTSRGGEDRYSVNGIYTEGGTIFVILQDRESLEYVRCDLTITSQDTVELAAEMQAVKHSWTPKPPVQEENLESLSGGEAVADQDIPMNVAATYTEGEGTQEEVPATDKVEQKVETEEPPIEFTEGSQEAEVKKPVEESVKQEIPDPVPGTEFTEESPTTATPEPTTDYAQENASLKAQIAEYTETIARLEGELAVYQEAEKQTIERQKEELIQSYSTLLTEEEIKPISEKASEYSLDDIEAKLAVVFTRKQKANAKPATEFQLDIKNIKAEDDSTLPSFMKQAMEIEKRTQIKLA